MHEVNTLFIKCDWMIRSNLQNDDYNPLSFATSKWDVINQSENRSRKGRIMLLIFFRHNGYLQVYVYVYALFMLSNEECYELIKCNH